MDYYDWHLDNTHQSKTSSHVTEINVFLEIDSTHTEPVDNWFRNSNLEENEAYVVFIPKKDHPISYVVNAKLKELQHFKDYQVYRTVPDEGQHRISSGWIVTREEIDGK